MKFWLDPTTLAVPAFIIAIIAEILCARILQAKARYGGWDTAVSASMGVGNLVVSTAQGGVISSIMLWFYAHRLFDGLGPTVVGWALLFVLNEIQYYWFHRLSHRHRFWWASHVNHHSSQFFNLSVSLRETWTGGVALTWILVIPLVLIGYPPWMMAIINSFNLIYQFWIHTETIGKLPKAIEYIFNTPSHHRVHHASNIPYLDKNYGGTLIVWDRLFGTFQDELASTPCRYGITKNLESFNLLHAVFHEWTGIMRDLLIARTTKEAFLYVFGRPGWKPDRRP